MGFNFSVHQFLHLEHNDNHPPLCSALTSTDEKVYCISMPAIITSAGVVVKVTLRLSV